MGAANAQAKQKLDSDNLKRLSESSPARKSSIGRITSSVVEAFSGAIKNAPSAHSINNNNNVGRDSIVSNK